MSEGEYEALVLTDITIEDDDIEDEDQTLCEHGTSP
jgi:hypothetical protein